jgi:two-component system sensor histidine kinase DesK
MTAARRSISERSPPSPSISWRLRAEGTEATRDEPADASGVVTDPPPDGTKWMRYVWLVYLVALFFQPAFDPSASLLDWVAVVVLIAVFLPLYVAGYRAAGDRQLLLIIGVMTALGVAGSLINGGASVFVIYAAGFAAYLEPVRRAVLVIAALVGILALMLAISPVPQPWRFVGLAPALVFTIVTGAANLFDAERERAQRRLRRADEEIERLAALAERERIARDLHDLLGHTLSLIVVKSELAARLVESDSQRAGDEMRDVERIGREALAEVRAAVVGYRAKGLRGELDGARQALAAAGVEATIEADLPALPIASESALALALRESVTNVVRHAGARHATVRLIAEESSIILEVTDDGRGSSGPEGAGITGMRERITALGGTVQRDGGPGTRVRVCLPVEATSRNDGAQPSERSGHP